MKPAPGQPFRSRFEQHTGRNFDVEDAEYLAVVRYRIQVGAARKGVGQFRPSHLESAPCLERGRPERNRVSLGGVDDGVGTGCDIPRQVQLTLWLSGNHSDVADEVLGDLRNVRCGQYDSSTDGEATKTSGVATEACSIRASHRPSEVMIASGFWLTSLSPSPRTLRGTSVWR